MDRLIPRRLVSYECGEDGRVILLKPKFRLAVFQKYLMPRMKRPYFRVYLDEIGSCVWNYIDGQRNALEITRQLQAELGDKIEPVYERFGLFLRQLKTAGFISY